MILIAIGAVVVVSLVLGLVAYALLTVAKEADEAAEAGEKRDCFAERAMTKAEAQAERFKDTRPTTRFVCPSTGKVINDKECADTARFKGCDESCPYPGSSPDPSFGWVPRHPLPQGAREKKTSYPFTGGAR